MAAISDLYHKFMATSVPLKLVIINFAIFIALRLIGIIAMIGGWDINAVVDYLALPSPLDILAQHPWTAVTYMFTHYEVFHIIFNMLTLYWFGKMLLLRCSNRQLVWLYIYGGLLGATFFLVGAQLFDGVGGWLLGASSAVIAIVIATAVLMPDFRISLFLIGSIQIKWVAIAAFLFFALGLVGDNAAAHITHFGGMTMGIIFALLLKNRIDITRPLNNLFDYISSFIKRCLIRKNNLRSKPKFKFKSKASDTSTPASHADDRRNLDAILDKIKHSGYTSLSADERKQLFDISRRVK